MCSAVNLDLRDARRGEVHEDGTGICLGALFNRVQRLALLSLQIT